MVMMYSRRSSKRFETADGRSSPAIFVGVVDGALPYRSHLLASLFLLSLARTKMQPVIEPVPA